MDPHLSEGVGMGLLSEYSSFFREFRRDFHHTGAVLPSGTLLARALARPLSRKRPPARILEVGPGTGSVTRAIVRLMKADDRLTCVEINPRFAELLRHRLDGDADFARRRGQIDILEAAVQDVPGKAAYDYIISGLPMNNFTVAEVRSVFAAFQRLLASGGTLTYFEYILIRQLKMPFVSRQERQRLAEVGAVVSAYIRACQVGQEFVLVNVPPAVVRQLRLSDAPCEPQQHSLS